MKLNNLEDVFKHQLQDLHSAEQQLTEALPKMAEAASSSELKEAFKEHLEQTREQQRRIEELGETLGVDVKGETCQAMTGLIKEGAELIQENSPSDALDAALIAASQRIEHYEIAAYGSTVAYAKRLGHSDAQNLLQRTLDEEGETDKKLTKIAESTINKEAMQS